MWPRQAHSHHFRIGKKIAHHRPNKGKVVLLFQPAEECEQGAKDIVNSNEFKQLNPDFIFGLHNIPNTPKRQVLIKNGSIAAASKGMTIKLFGKSSHAAEPERGISPAIAISKIIKELHLIING